MQAGVWRNHRKRAFRVPPLGGVFQAPRSEASVWSTAFRRRLSGAKICRLKAVLQTLAPDGCSFTEGANVGWSDLAKGSRMTVASLHYDVMLMAVRLGVQVPGFARRHFLKRA